MAGRYKQFNETEVLQRAMNVFWKKGYEATSTEDLLLAMELNKGSLYNTFKSKKELFVRVVDHFGDFLLQHVDGVVKSQPNTIEGIKFLFRNICRDTLEDRERGCFLGNSISELSNIDGDMEKKALHRLRLLEELFEQYLKEGQSEGLLNKKVNIKLVARHLVTLWNGLYVMVRMYELKELQEVINLNLKVLD